MDGWMDLMFVLVLPTNFRKSVGVDARNFVKDGQCAPESAPTVTHEHRQKWDLRATCTVLHPYFRPVKSVPPVKKWAFDQRTFAGFTATSTLTSNLTEN